MNSPKVAFSLLLQRSKIRTHHYQSLSSLHGYVSLPYVDPLTMSLRLTMSSVRRGRSRTYKGLLWQLPGSCNQALTWLPCSDHCPIRQRSHSPVNLAKGFRFIRLPIRWRSHFISRVVSFTTIAVEQASCSSHPLCSPSPKGGPCAQRRCRRLGCGCPSSLPITAGKGRVCLQAYKSQYGRIDFAKTCSLHLATILQSSLESRSGHRRLPAYWEGRYCGNPATGAAGRFRPG